MPADLTALDSDRGNIANLFGFATGFGTRVKNFMTRCFGASNPFGTVAARDTATARTANGIPSLDGDGDIRFLQMPAATGEAKGAVGIGIPTSPALQAFGGQNYPLVADISAVESILSPFTDNIISGNIEIADLALRNYGPSGALRTAFVIPRFACFIIISANGGFAGVSTTILEPVTQRSFSISLVSTDGTTLAAIAGGGTIRIIRDFGGQTGSYPSSVPAATNLPNAALESLGLEFGVVLNRFGAPGSRRQAGTISNQASSANARGKDYVIEGHAADLLLAYKGETDAPLLWLTDNPVPPYFRRTNLGLGFNNATELPATLGYAYYIRMR